MSQTTGQPAEMPADVSSSATGGYTTGRRMSAVHVHVSFLGNVHAEIVKLISLTSTWWLTGLIVVLLPLVNILLSSAIKLSSTTDVKTRAALAKVKPIPDSTLWFQMGATITLLMLIAGIFGVMSITSEYTTSAVQASLTVNPHRMMFLHAKAVAVMLFTFVASLVGLLLSWLASRLLLSGMQITPLKSSEAYVPYVVIFGGALVMTFVAVLGLGLGAICRSTVGGVFSLLGLLMFLSSLVNLISGITSALHWLSSVATVLPDTSASNFIQAGMGGSASLTDGQFSPTWWQSGLIFLVWAAVFYAIGAIVVKHADIK